MMENVETLRPGRKSIRADRKATIKNVSLKPEEWEAAESAAEALGVSRSELFRLALRDYLAKTQKTKSKKIM